MGIVNYLITEVNGTDFVVFKYSIKCFFAIGAEWVPFAGLYCKRTVYVVVGVTIIIEVIDVGMVIVLIGGGFFRLCKYTLIWYGGTLIWYGGRNQLFDSWRWILVLVVGWIGIRLPKMGEFRCSLSW